MKLEISSLVEVRDLLWECRRIDALSKKDCNGLHTHPLYRVWMNIFNRCYNSMDNGFPLYGARGISICDRWLSLKNFIEDMGDNEGLTIDRIDPDGNYEPNNCRWASKRLQSENRRLDRVIYLSDIHSRIMKERKITTRKNSVHLNDCYRMG